MVCYPDDVEFPLLVSTQEPYEAVWLPKNDERDFVVTCHPRNGQELVTSPGLNFSQYVPKLSFKLSSNFRTDSNSCSSADPNLHQESNVALDQCRRKEARYINTEGFH